MTSNEFESKYGSTIKEMVKELCEFLDGLVKENLSTFENDNVAVQCLLNVYRNFFIMGMFKLSDVNDCHPLTMIINSKIVEFIEQMIKENEAKNEKV